MTEKERFIKALKHEPITGHVPHFELVFYLTMEVLGKVHPEHRNMSQWKQMSPREKELQLQDAGGCFIDIARKYNHSAIFVHPSVNDFDSVRRLLEIIRERTDDGFFLMMHGDPTYSIPGGEDILEFSAQIYEEPEQLHEKAKIATDKCLENAQQFAKTGLLDGFCLCSDYCFNTNPFLSPDMFGELVAPYLKRVIAGYHDMGFYSIKHTDGNIMPIIEQILDCKPDALHSLDPQAGVDLRRVKERYGKRVCLIGNVNCGLLQTGSEEQVREDALRSLKDGMPGYGYVFSTSNCVYTGLELERYELIHSIWREQGIYTK